MTMTVGRSGHHPGVLTDTPPSDPLDAVGYLSAQPRDAHHLARFTGGLTDRYGGRGCSGRKSMVASSLP
jgi:hypothetical protein